MNKVAKFDQHHQKRQQHHIHHAPLADVFHKVRNLMNQSAAVTGKMSGQCSLTISRITLTRHFMKNMLRCNPGAGHSAAAVEPHTSSSGLGKTDTAVVVPERHWPSERCFDCDES